MNSNSDRSLPGFTGAMSLGPCIQSYGGVASDQARGEQVVLEANGCPRALLSGRGVASLPATLGRAAAENAAFALAYASFFGLCPPPCIPVVRQQAINCILADINPLSLSPSTLVFRCVADVEGVCQDPPPPPPPPQPVPDPVLNGDSGIDFFDILLITAVVVTVVSPIPGDEVAVGALGAARLARIGARLIPKRPAPIPFPRPVPLPAGG